MKNIIPYLCLTFVLCLNFISLQAHFKTTPNSPVHITEEGKLVYKAYPNGASTAWKWLHRLVRSS